MMLIIRPNSTFQFHFALASMNVAKQSFPNHFSNWLLILFPYLVCKQMPFDLRQQVILSHLLPMNKKT